MEDGAFGGSFGKYDVTTYNTNKRNKGYSNSLNEQSNFSTTLGANFSTTVGCSVSTVSGANLPNTEGGKIELIAPFSVKWTLGLYDYDFKYVRNLIKNVSATNQYTSNVVVNDYKGYYGTTTKVTPKDEEYVAQATKLLGTRAEIIQEGTTKILNATCTYGTLTTTVATRSVEKVSTGEMQKYALRTQVEGYSYCKIGCTAPGGGVLSMVPGGATMKGTIIKIG